MTLTCEESEGRRLIRLAGDAAFETAGQLRAVLLEALGAGAPSALELTGATELDLGLVQVIVSARRTFAARGVPLRVVDGPDGLWEKWLAATGIGGDINEQNGPDCG